MAKNRKARRAARNETPSEIATPREAPRAPVRSGRGWVRFAVFVVLAGAILAWLSTRPPPADRVWDPEHGHYHTVSGEEVPPPEGLPGQVWDPEHGHWHDPDDAEVETIP
jgi:hypothetical protein